MANEVPAPVSNFIRTIITEDLRTGKHTRVATRFPPEPNGYLHIGHAKSICLNFVGIRGRLDARAGGLDHFGLRVPAAEWRRLSARLRRAGVRIVGRRERSAVYIEDPNGYTVELYRD